MKILFAILSFVISYLIGSVMFGVIISKQLMKQDVRTVGSKSAGMTNVLRNYGKWPAVLTAIGDFAKGLFAVYISRIICTSTGATDYVMAGFIGAWGVLLGHAFPLFFQFHGGKGVMTGFAAIIMLDWKIAVIAFSVFLIVVALTRYVSLGSILAAITFPVASLIAKRAIFPNVLGGVIVAAFVVYLHRANIVRLAKGEESKLGNKRKG